MSIFYGFYGFSQFSYFERLWLQKTLIDGAKNAYYICTSVLTTISEHFSHIGECQILPHPSILHLTTLCALCLVGSWSFPLDPKLPAQSCIYLPERLLQSNASGPKDNYFRI